ncbi:hypothetical protein [Nocardia sp. alder85J]|uniref:hypothetical protein n=1 Tax=Nocardia sp. alder85J TaxID=2862949 RepID=UPI001CD7EC19|nr:hypothetical protein [Nocardia sp. alder85J]MCX4093889.1 hypothetical protein [Nocardia sp. alder85J]
MSGFRKGERLAVFGGGAVFGGLVLVVAPVWLGWALGGGFGLACGICVGVVGLLALLTGGGLLWAMSHDSD